MKCSACGTKVKLGEQPTVLERFLGAEKKKERQLDWEHQAKTWQSFHPRWACYNCILDEVAVRAVPHIQKYPATKGPFLCYFDQQLRCQYCAHSFVFSGKEQKFWYEKLQFHTNSVPVACYDCRRRLREPKVANKLVAEKLTQLEANNWCQLSELAGLSWRARHREKALEYLRRAKNCCETDAQREALTESIELLEASELPPLPERRFRPAVGTSELEIEVETPGAEEREDDFELDGVVAGLTGTANLSAPVNSPPEWRRPDLTPNLRDFVSAHAVYCVPECCGRSAFEFDSGNLELYKNGQFAPGTEPEALTQRFNCHELAADLQHARENVQKDHSHQVYQLDFMNWHCDRSAFLEFLEQLERRVLVLSEA